MISAKETIRLGQIELTFLLDGSNTGNKLVMFEFLIPPGAKVPIPHYHKDVDEVLYGLEGITTSIVDGQLTEIAAGDRLFIPRGAVHYHENRTPNPAKTLVILTPDSIGPAYFRELRELMQPGLPPDPGKAAEIMLKHGLVPVTENKPA